MAILSQPGVSTRVRYDNLGEGMTKEQIRANAPIKELDFTCGTYNSLRHAGICTVADLASKTEDELNALIPLAMSPWKRIDEIKVVLRRHGHSLAALSPVAPQIP